MASIIDSNEKIKMHIAFIFENSKKSGGAYYQTLNYWNDINKIFKKRNFFSIHTNKKENLKIIDHKKKYFFYYNFLDRIIIKLSIFFFPRFIFRLIGLKTSFEKSLLNKKVDFKAIKMTTAGMGSGTVNYTLTIPFMAVNSKCEAFTSFDHVGGWNHQPALERRKKELKHVTLEGQKLEISELKQTKEGLQEYWIQWKNKNLQSTCK